MTPVSLNSPTPSFPLTDQIEDRAQLFNISSNNLDSTNSLSCPSFFNLLDQTQSREIGALRHDQEDEVVLHVGSSSDGIRNSSFISPQPVKDDPSNLCGHNSSVICETEEEERRSEYESPKWMSSKMRLMRKMMRPSHNPNSGVTHRPSNVTAPTLNQNQEHENRQASPHIPISHRNSTTRVCADCNTTSTPLWRGGPKGPKSLCNACGIRQRKARRALMAEAANGDATSSTKTTSSSRVHNKEKKRRTDHLLQLKNKSKSTSTARAATSHDQPQPQTNSFGLVDQLQVFPRDEVAQAALLLMDLSCAFLPI